MGGLSEVIGESGGYALFAECMGAEGGCIGVEEGFEADGTMEKSADSGIVIDVIETIAGGPGELLQAAAENTGIGMLADGGGGSGSDWAGTVGAGTGGSTA